eukprot:jgi/Psemu1/26461/gm1.26461_g
MKIFLFQLLSCLLTTVVVIESFATTTSSQGRRSLVSSVSLAASVTDEESSSGAAPVAASQAETDAAPNGLLGRDRYVASNRFAVRPGREAKFEKRWATRKSRLAELDGFRYFHLMRRVTLNEDTGATEYDAGEDKKSLQGNYVSFTVWETKKDFSAWRKGNAFKEAHGGTSIGAFMSTMISSAMVLKGPPRPAFYDGLLVQSEAPEFLPETVDGWRSIEFPEEGTLPAECFVACNQFFVPRDNAVAFEQRWKNRESKLRDCEGFVAFSMMRRDGQAKGHGTVEMDESVEPTYLSTTIWKDRASFEKWRNGSNFSKSHGQSPKGTDETKEASPKKPPQTQGPPMWSRPPKPIFYEGTLVIATANGA